MVRPTRISNHRWLGTGSECGRCRRWYGSDARGDPSRPTWGARKLRVKLEQTRGDAEWPAATASEVQAQDGAPLLGLIARFRYPCISVRISGAALRLIAADGATNNYSLLRPIIGSMRVARRCWHKRSERCNSKKQHRNDDECKRIAWANRKESCVEVLRQIEHMARRLLRQPWLAGEPSGESFQVHCWHLLP